MRLFLEEWYIFMSDISSFCLWTVMGSHNSKCALNGAWSLGIFPMSCWNLREKFAALKCLSPPEENCKLHCDIYHVKFTLFCICRLQLASLKDTLFLVALNFLIDMLPMLLDFLIWLLTMSVIRACFRSFQWLIF